MGTYLVLDLELLALTNIRGLGDGRLKAVEGLVVEGLFHVTCQSSPSPSYLVNSGEGGSPEQR